MPYCILVTLLRTHALLRDRVNGTMSYILPGKGHTEAMDDVHTTGTDNMKDSKLTLDPGLPGAPATPAIYM